MHCCVARQRRASLKRLTGLAFTFSLLGNLLPATTAHAQVPRNFPATALRGELVVTLAPEVMLNQRPARLAPGARIRGTNNLMVLSGQLTGQRLLVHYTLDNTGLLQDVWLLTTAEAAKRPWPVSPEQAAQWTFNADAQTWSPR